jgi:hypothetical protein
MGDVIGTGCSLGIYVVSLPLALLRIHRTSLLRLARLYVPTEISLAEATNETPHGSD